LDPVDIVDRVDKEEPRVKNPKAEKLPPTHPLLLGDPTEKEDPHLPKPRVENVLESASISTQEMLAPNLEQDLKLTVEPSFDAMIMEML
jgi:hypothetical protein